MRAPVIGLVLAIVACGAFAQPESGPADPKAQKTFASALDWVRHHDYAAAVGSFRKADKQDGGHCRECAYQIVKYGLETGDFKDANAAAEQLIADARSPEDTARARLERGTVQFREGLVQNKPECLREADREFELTLAAYPRVPEALFFDGIALAHLNRDADARARFEKYLELAPADDEGRSRARRYLENPELARARMAPEFSITTLDGRQVSLDGLAGHVVLIDFWATWCGPCRQALPHIRDIAQRFSTEPLVVLSVSLDHDEAQWKQFVAKNHMTWLQYRDSGGSLTNLFAVHAIPHTFTIDADGVLQDEHIGDAEIEGKLKKLCARAHQVQEAPQTSRLPSGQ